MLGLLPVSRHLKRIEFEVQYNRFDPFMVSMALYVLAMLLVLGSWLIYPRPMLRAAFVAMSLALLVHTAGLAARIYIQGRPPVTNLYSSAVFIGWFAIVLAIGVELLYRNGVASLCASLCGFGTLIVAQHLSLSGDTMGALQAVLDSNFWLTTHVLAITCGYSAAFLAGLLGAVWLLAGLSPRFFAGAEESAAQRLDRAVYGIICFAMLFSFVGTVLGGIWADQSWGRFWGWDPKENGAVLIVLWLAAMLHARAGRLIGARGFAVMAVGGNIVTAWSWFGTNMLGVGLHSYGFMDEALGWLLAFVGVNLLLMLVAFFVSKAGRCDE
jgi:ABC-type transport system involved in cytochrome c biogenesis permease subunit